MLGSFVPRVLLMVFGYAYPAYECYKTVENKPENEQLLFWCKYWTLVAFLTVLERVGDALFSWLPLYSESKLALFIYLWSSKVKWTTYLYNRFFRDFVAQHEAEIDRKILELRERTGDIANLGCQKALKYGQRGVFEILQFVSSQSPSQPYRDQKQEKGTETVITTPTERTTSEAEEKLTEPSVPLSAKTIPPSRKTKQWLRKLIR